MTGALIAVGLLFLGLFVFVPFMIVRAVRSSRRARNFIPDLLRLTGLQLNGQRLSGSYGGQPTTVDFGLGMNVAKVAFGPGEGLERLEGRNTFFQTLHVKMRVPGANFPPLALKEKVGLIRTDQFINDLIAGKKLELPEMPGVKIQRARAYGQDQTFAQTLVRDAELQRLLSDWYYADIRIGGDGIELVLDDNMVMPTFGSKRMSSPGYVVQALDICARIAAIGKA